MINTEPSTTTVLVTEGTCFLGIHIINRLLTAGFKVRTTLPPLRLKRVVISDLKNSGITCLDNLSFIKADASGSYKWNEAVRGCNYVLHMSSIFYNGGTKNKYKLIPPTTESILNILQAAKDEGVNRVVLTSSFQAVSNSPKPKNHLFTENDWTDPDGPVNGQVRSNTMMELAAWKFIGENCQTMDLTVINPVGIFGPVLGKNQSGGIDLIKKFISGGVKDSPDFSFGAVDVRDLADLHILAMTHPAARNERFLAAADGALTFYDIAKLIVDHRPHISGSMAALQPNDPDVYIGISNKKARNILGWTPKSKEEAVLASLDSLLGQPML